MNTLGNRGEREKNAKPKFASLDINNLYRTSRGEPTEPTAQKNAAPRKHGMQSLGKVPSARRPPANLPSLKAETSAPTSNSATSAVEQQPATSQNQASANSTGQKWADSSLESGSAGGGSKSTDKSRGSQGGNNANNTSWSSVATRKTVKEEPKGPLYASPHFQNEFPSLDGTTNASMPGVNVNTTRQHQQNSNSTSGGDSHHDHASGKSNDGNWQHSSSPQQSNSGNVRGGAGENGPSSVYEAAAASNNVPRTILSLMPSFIKSKVQPVDDDSPAPVSQSSNSASSMQRDHHHQQQQHRGGERDHGDQRYQQHNMNRRGNYSNNYNDYQSGPRHRQQPPPRHAGRSQHDDRSSSYEPEVITQRPIIKDEELDRIDSLARDDGGWSKNDEIDYNKKLQFSDDEIDDDKPKESENRHAMRDDRRELKQQNGPMQQRSVDRQLLEKMNKRREEEEQMERERKMAAQKKLMELDEKAKGGSKDGKENDEKLDERKKDQRSSADYGKKYDKYDSYDNYNRGPPASSNYNKPSYQSNLPPRFLKQQQLDGRHEPSSKPGPPGYGKSMIDNKSMSSHSSYDQQQRWGYSKQQPSSRRNMSSLSQSSSDDNNRRDNVKNYQQRRHQDEDNDEFGKKKMQQAQTTRSMSESSDKLSDHNRSDKSTSREHLGLSGATSGTACWAESMELEKKSRRVSESSAMSDDQPRTILQRNKPLPEQLKEVKNESMKDEVKADKSVLSEASADNDELKKGGADDKSESKKNLESIPEKEQKEDKKDSGKALDDRHKKSPRSNNNSYDSRDTRYSSRGGYSSYRGGNQGYNRRGGGHRGSGHYDYNSDSDNSDDYDQNWKNKMGGSGSGRKQMDRGYGQKDSFQPRGEPSRRGRGGGASAGQQSSSFRRSGSNGAIQPPSKNYGPPSSKSPFGSNDEKLEKSSKDKLSDDDRTKQKQKALSDGLLNKSQKESSNVATQKASSPSIKLDESKQQQHSTEQQQLSLDKDRKQQHQLDDELKTMGARSASSSSFNSSQGNKKANVQSSKTATATTVSTSSSSTIGAKTTPKTSPSSSQFSSKPSSMQPSRNNDRIGNDRNDSRNASNNRGIPPRLSKHISANAPLQSGGNRPGSYWDKNSENDDKMSMNMLSNAPSNNSNNSIQSNNAANSNLMNSKTDVMKQSSQQQQQHPQTVHQQQQHPGQAMMDGGSLSKTLIFENTSYKTAGPPGGHQQQMVQAPQKPKSRSTIEDMIAQSKEHQSLENALNFSFGQKNDIVNDMSFSYPFDPQIGLLGDDRNKTFGVVSSSSNSHPSQTVSKSSSLGLVGSKGGLQNSNILNTDTLNMKVASCKKVWEDPSSMEHSASGATDDVIANFVAQQPHLHQYTHHSGLMDHSSLEHFNKSNDNDDSTSYSSSGQQQHMVHSQSQQAMKTADPFASSSSVGKVKQSQQGIHQTGLSPPPMQQNQLQQQQQQQQQQTYYQNPSYPNMSTIPSPPAVVYPQPNVIGGFYSPYVQESIEKAKQLYGYPTGNANNSLSFNTFMQTPNLASAPTHEMYQNMSQYRTTVQPFSHSQTPQMNNPNAALIPSGTPAANSIMSSKSSSQIGAIGSKSSQNTGQTGPSANQYGQQHQYMSHLYHQQQNSYYTNSTAQQGNPYYSGPTGNVAAATGNYGMFPSQHNSNAPPSQPQQMSNFGQYNPIGSQMLNNMVINQPPYRSGPVVPGNSSSSNPSGSSSNANSGYMKQQHQSQMPDWEPAPNQNRNFNSPNHHWPSPIQKPNYQHYDGPPSQQQNFSHHQRLPRNAAQHSSSIRQTQSFSKS